MLDYKTLDKTDWLIQKMRTGAFSRQEIVNLAATEFPTVAWRTLDGTIGQYWSDSINPKWSTYKAIRARGLKIVVVTGGRRRIVEDRESFTALGTPNSRLSPRKDFPVRAGGRGTGTAGYQSRSSVQNELSKSVMREIWNGNDRELWQRALTRYWAFVKPANLALEKEMDQLDAETIRAMTPPSWYRFLLEKYFRWKYTHPTATVQLRNS